MGDLFAGLPEVNGSILCGLAAVGEDGLADWKKLQVNPSLPLKVAAQYAVAQLVNSDGFMGFSGDQQSYLIASAAAVVLLGLSGKIAGGTELDGDVSIVTTATVPTVTDPQKALVLAAWTEENIKRAATMISAAKINWWKTNHHTGQGSMSGYTLKVATQLYGGPIAATLGDHIHRASHWAGTITVLGMLGVSGLRAVTPLIATANNIRAAADAQLRIDSAPAGTAKHHVAHQLAKKLISHSVVAYCPDADEFAALQDVIAAIKANRASYHMGANYLVGTANSKRDTFKDDEAKKYLGRLGAYGNAYLKSGTIMKSPCVAGGGYKNCDDFSAEFESVLAAIQQASLKKMSVQVASASAFITKGSYTALATKFGVKENAAVGEILDKWEAEKTAAATAAAASTATPAADPFASLFTP